MFKEDALVKVTGLHGKSETIAVVANDQEKDKPVRVMCLVTFSHCHVDASQIVSVAKDNATHATMLKDIEWEPVVH